MGDIFTIYYKGRPNEVKNPDGWKVVTASRPAPEIPKLTREDIVNSLENPIGSKRIRELVKEAPGKDAVIVTEDSERPGPVHEVMNPIIDLLEEAGIGKSRINVVVATGTHQPHDELMKEKLGNKVFERVNKVVNHDQDAKDLVHIGTTTRGTPVWLNRLVATAGIRIGVGGVKPHHAAGYGGGAKIVCPGVVGRETITRNHLLLVQPECEIFRTRGNPLWEEALEIARMAKLHMKVDRVSNMKKEIVGVFAGEPEATQKRGIELFNDIYGVFVPQQPLDVAIISGYPMEVTLGQSSGGLFNALPLVKDGGHMVLATDMTAGIGSKTAYEVLNKRLSVQDLVRKVEKGELGAGGLPAAMRYIRILERKMKVTIVTDEKWKSQLRDMGLDHESSIQDAVDSVHEKLPIANVGVFPMVAFSPVRA